MSPTHIIAILSVLTCTVPLLGAVISVLIVKYKRPRHLEDEAASVVVWVAFAIGWLLFWATVLYVFLFVVSRTLL